jgi:hypothetical protein
MLYRKPTLAALLALIFFSFFGTLTVSAWMFPQNYDWRYRVIPNLLSPRDNPNHYWFAAGGLVLTGLLMLPFASDTPETLLGDTDSRRAAPFRVLAPRFLGVDRCCCSVCFSLRGDLLNTATDEPVTCRFVQS